MRVLVLAFTCLFLLSKTHAQTLIAHYNVASSVTVSDGSDGVVDQLNDLSGNNYHLTRNGTNVYHPPNGLFPYVTFPNFDSQLKIADIPDVAQPFTLYMIVRQNAFANGAHLATFKIGSGGTAIKQSEYISGLESIKSVVPEASGILADKRNKLSNLYSNSWRLLKFVFNGESSYETVNGGARLLSTLFPKPSGPGPSTFTFYPGANPIEFISIGGEGTTGIHSSFDFAEMRLYTSMTDAQALIIEQSLISSYGLSPVVGIKAFGDSNTVGIGASDENTKSWLYLTATEKNKAYYNYGINTTVVFSNGFAGSHPEYDTYGFTATRVLGAYGTTDYCFFMYGTNDPVFNESWKLGYKQLIKESFIDPPFNYATSKLIICSPPYTLFRNMLPARDYCSQIASELGIQFADLYTAMVNTGNPLSYLSGDGYHLNNEGHRLAADLFKAFIDQGPLPVTFTLFNSACTNSAVKLTWKTAQEFNSKRFDVERSSDGRIWYTIGSVTATGISNTEMVYSFTDNAPSADFYRVVEVGTDNRKIFTTVLKSPCSKSREEFVAFPNPVNNFTTITITSGAESPIELKLYDSKGALVRFYKNQILQGVNHFQVNMSGLAEGIYTLRATWNNSNKAIQLVK